MFTFKFEETNQFLDDGPLAKKPKEDETVETTISGSVVWYLAEEVKPNEEIISCMDIYELNAKEVKNGNTELRHLIAGFLLENIKSQNDTESRDIKKSEESHSDLITGVYEGGAKIWECTGDLLNYLSKNYDDAFWKNKRVLDLGCGSGLLGIYAFKNEAQVDFQDYNKDVLEQITMPNVLLNLSDSLTDSEKIETLKSKTKYYSGDWSHFTHITEKEEKYDVILTSETIYNIENQRKLLNTFEKRLATSGVVLVAAKSHYFGVGGGLQQFENVIKKDEIFNTKILWEAAENLKRGVLELRLK